MFKQNWMRWTITAFLLALAAGCAAVDGDYCALTQPIWWDSAEELERTPPAIVRQVTVHNEIWDLVCR